MNGNPLDIINEHDAELFKNVAGTKAMALEDGALAKKYKLLIALALDSSHGTVDGVRSLAIQALDSGSNKDEIMESIRVANFISGVGCVYTAAKALKDIL